MKILFSAFACEPGRGSEEGVGWNIPWAVSQRNDVHVLTTPRHRPAIEAHLKLNPNSRLSFSYYDLPHAVLRHVRTTELWQLYYYLWQRRIARWARDVIDQFGPNIIHHITYVRYWTPNSLWRPGCPFVFGPVGGAEDTPRSFLKTFSLGARWKERARRWARLLSERDPALRATYAHASIAIANTNETATRMLRLGASNVQVMGESALSSTEAGLGVREAFADSGPFTFLVAARLLHWKGVHLALHALAVCRTLTSEMDIVGDGPERGRLKQLVTALGLSERVRFHGKIPREQVLAMFQHSRALVHASLHDSGGWVCLEAMAAQVPVICLDLGGPATQVTPESGYLIAAGSPEQAIADIASAMDQLCGDAGLAARMGAAGRERTLGHFTWQRKAEQFEQIYRGLV